MSEIEQLLERWQASLCQNIGLAGLVARNPIAYKWKAPHRSLLLRESIFWRTHDLLTQAHLLFTQSHILGSRILLRGALETAAILIHLNQMTEQVLSGQLNFHEFSNKTSQLLLGSRNKTTKHEALNIVGILQKCDKRYSGISDVYADLCECAHPNYEGLSFGYSRVDFENHETNFGNYWYEMWGDRHESLVSVIGKIVEYEYNDVWFPQIEKLENWLTEHDAMLEETKS